MTAAELVAEALLRARRLGSRAISRATDAPQSTYVSDEELRQSLEGRSITEVASRIRESRGSRLTSGLADLEVTVAKVKEFFPDSVETTRLEAEAILNHRISVFGRVHDLGPTIDWHRDPHADVRWPLLHFTRVPLLVGRGADVRVVWELNRLQHLTTLGRAYLLTGDDRYTEAFLIQLASWYEENPPRFGPNWMNAMEAAIRSISIIASLEMLRSSPQMSDEAIELILKVLLAHGRFIRRNLEFNYRAPSNHYLSDLIGLFAIGMTVPELSESRGWVSYGARGLLQEMDRQVLGDGVDYEGSIGYHRFVLEIFALFFQMSHASGIEIPGRYWERLEAMFDFVRHYLKPDESAPMIGDSDDGRLLRFKTRPADDHSYMMSIGAVLIESGKFKPSGRIDEEAIWWFGNRGLEAFDSLTVNQQQPGSRAFRESQIFVQRSDAPLYAIIDCGDHGARGRGSHAHSDALSIEVSAFNQTFLVDPGTFGYTVSERRRNLFRSTAYHNTVRIDGEEISQISEGEFFAFVSNVRPQINRWESDSERDVLDAEHYGYQRLASPVTHRRIITFDKRDGYWTIEDLFTGEGEHRFEFFFNFDAGLDVALDSSKRATARSESASLTIVPHSDLELEPRIEPRWVSPAYGTRLNASAIIYTLSGKVPLRVRFKLLASRLAADPEH